MTQTRTIQTNFTAGELSPRLDGRVDLSKYFNGCTTLQNAVIHPHGGASRRSGTRYVATVKTSAKKTRLVPFEFSVVQPYVIEFGDAYCRFYMDEGQITASGSPYEIVSPYAEADLFELQFAQSADNLYITHPDYAPRKLSRTGHAAWTFTVISFTDGPFDDVNTTATTLALSGTSGSVTVTASAALFAAADVGRLIRWKDPAGNWTWLTITAFTDTTHVTATISGPAASAGTATANWRLGTWYQAGAWPACVGFFSDRLYFAGSTDRPQTVWGSVAGDFENFAPTAAAGTIADDNAVTFTIATDQVNAIRWLSPGRALALGTTGGEFLMQASTAEEAITPTNIQIRRHTTRGCAYVQPVRRDEALLFLQRAARKIHEFAYSFDLDAFKAPDMTILAEHITAGGVVELAFAEAPDGILWAPRTDGVLLGMTYEHNKNVDVTGWHRHVLGGAFGAGSPVVESVAVIPAPSADHDQLWLVVKRTIDSATVRTVEFMEQGFAGDDAQEDAYFVDCGLTYDGSAATVISGLDHLEGQTVSILADGAVRPDAVVASGAVTLSTSASVVHVGLPYTTIIEGVRPDLALPDGSAQGAILRIVEMTARLWRSLGGKLGASGSLETIAYRSSADLMGSPPALFTGDKKVPFPAGYGKDIRPYGKQDQPLPFTVLAYMAKVEVGNG